MQVSYQEFQSHTTGTIEQPLSHNASALREEISIWFIFDLYDRTTPSPPLRSGTSPDQVMASK